MPMTLISNPIHSPQALDNECNIFYSSLFINDVGRCYIYIYIYIVNLLVEFVIISIPILSHKDNYCTFILSSYVFIGCGGDGYIYIYIYIYI